MWHFHHLLAFARGLQRGLHQFNFVVIEVDLLTCKLSSRFDFISSTYHAHLCWLKSGVSKCIPDLNSSLTKQSQLKIYWLVSPGAFKHIYITWRHQRMEFANSYCCWWCGQKWLELELVYQLVILLSRYSLVHHKGWSEGDGTTQPHRESKCEYNSSGWERQQAWIHQQQIWEQNLHQPNGGDVACEGEESV